MNSIAGKSRAVDAMAERIAEYKKLEQEHNDRAFELYKSASNEFRQGRFMAAVRDSVLSDCHLVLSTWYRAGIETSTW